MLRKLFTRQASKQTDLPKIDDECEQALQKYNKAEEKLKKSKNPLDDHDMMVSFREYLRKCEHNKKGGAKKKRSLVTGRGKSSRKRSGKSSRKRSGKSSHKRSGKSSRKRSGKSSRKRSGKSSRKHM